MKEAYGEGPRFHAKSLEMISVINDIIDLYVADGYLLTVRQLYYQLVARNYIPNTVQSYDRTVALLTNARMAGLIDWDAIEDRTRGVIENQHWDSGSDILDAAARSYREDLWSTQESRVAVVVEKEALAGVLERTCRKWDVALLPARGYPSATTLREFAKARIIGACQQIVILHLGDHDPSGIDMSRDLEERLDIFSRHCGGFEFHRIALNMDQVAELNPPPNPAKVTDSRYGAYRSKYGVNSWELDALSPSYLDKLVEKHITEHIDFDLWRERENEVSNVRARIQEIADKFNEE